MNKRRAQEFRKLRAEELRRLSQVLLEEQVIRDPGPLLEAAAMCIKPEVENRQEYWEYSFYALQFYDIEDETLRHARPVGAKEVSLELSVTLRGPCLEEEDTDDPFNRLGVDIIAQGRGTGNTSLMCAWHLDKHLRDPGDNEPSFAHPDYHFQHGGRNVWDLNDYGSQLLLEPPRLAHPPLDGILAVDFVISNYFGNKWSELRTLNSTYRELVQSAQRRCWMPYAFATATICRSISVNGPWDAQLIWPQLIP